ncbi:MAG: hypothetical protein ACM3PS_02060 [Syntrophothermus sp.]
MDPIKEHNQALQQNGYFSAADLAWNRQRRYSPSQLQRIEVERSFLHQKDTITAQWTPPMLMITLVGLFLFMLALDPNGHLRALKTLLGEFFLPVVLLALALMLLFVIVIVLQPLQRPEGFDIKMDTMQSGPIQVIEGQAELYRSPGGSASTDRPSNQMNTILLIGDNRIPISERLSQVIQPNRLYRVYAINKMGTWALLSMEMDQAEKS